MPVIKPRIVEGIKDEIRGAASAPAMVNAATIRLGHCHAEGVMRPAITFKLLGKPKRLGIWSRMIRIPTPLMKPEMTGYGIYLMSLPPPMIPYVSWSAPAKKVTINKSSSTWSGERPGVVSFPASRAAARVVITAAAGAHGDETSRGDPPRSGATIPTTTAPMIPASAPCARYDRPRTP
jgi:hypothetical protein